MAISSLRKMPDDWAVEPRSLGTGILAARTLTRDEGRRSALQAMNVRDSDFVLRHGEVIGEAELVTTGDNEEGTPKAPEEEEVFLEEAAVSAERPLQESVLEESCDDAHIHVVIDNLPQELDQQTAARKFIRDRRVMHTIGCSDAAKRAKSANLPATSRQPVGNLLATVGNRSATCRQLIGHPSEYTIAVGRGAVVYSGGS